MVKWRNNSESSGEQDESNLSFVIQPNVIGSSPTDNKIYFYNEVNRESVLNTCRQIDDVTKQLRLLQLTYELDSVPAIELHINSDGGDVHSSLLLADKIIKNKIPIYTFVEGHASSGATIISMVGKKRFIQEHSFMLIHQMSAGWAGTYQSLLDEKENCDLLMKTIKEVYMKHSKFNAAELEDLLKHDLLLDANAALNLGMVDVIL